MYSTSTYFIPSTEFSVNYKNVTFAFSGHKFLAQTAAGLVYADCTIPEHGRSLVGMTLSAGAANTQATIADNGEIHEPSWNFIVSEPIYLGTSGNFTQTPPTTPGSIIMQVGYATSLNSIELKFSTPIIIS